jgi:hypothetical protein
VKGRTPTLHDAWQIADCLSKKGPKSDERLTHEHVFPRAQLIKLLQELDCPSKFDFVETRIEKLAIGCVVLQSENELLDARKGDMFNPWLRYKGFIRLAENQKWPDFQRQLILAAGPL